MLKIKLIIIGHSDRVIDFDLINNHKSNFFKYEDIDRIDNLPNPSKNDGYFNIIYSKKEVQELLCEIKFDGVCLAIMNYGFNDDFYMHQLDSNKVCISISNLESILLEKNISLENFIIKNTYKIYIFHQILNLTNDEVYNFVHRDTRGCLFDMNGDTRDIIFNTEKPKICDECQSKISKKTIPKNFLHNVQKELFNIKKPFIKTVELSIKRYPLFSILITFIFSTIINLFSNWIWNVYNG